MDLERNKTKNLTEEEFFDWLLWIKNNENNFSTDRSFMLNLIGIFGKDLDLFEKAVKQIKAKKYSELSNNFIINKKDIKL